MASSDRLRALVDLSRTISSSLDLEDVLRRFTDHATAVTGAAATAVSRWDRDRGSDEGTGFFGVQWPVVTASVHNGVLDAEHHRAESRLRALVDNLPAVTYMDTAGSGDPVYVSPQIMEMMGMPAEEWLVGFDGWEKRMHPDDRHTIADYRVTVETGRPYSAS